MRKIKCLLLITLLIFLGGCITPQEKYGPKMIPYMSGDCVDRAVKIRQDLRQQGYEAKLILGLDKEGKGHCWIRYKDKKTGKWIEIKN